MGIMGKLGPLSGKKFLEMGSGQKRQKMDTVEQVDALSGQHVFTRLDSFAAILTTCSALLRHTRQFYSNTYYILCASVCFAGLWTPEARGTVILICISPVHRPSQHSWVN